jgi:hypothetical protein
LKNASYFEVYMNRFSLRFLLLWPFLLSLSQSQVATQDSSKEAETATLSEATPNGKTPVTEITAGGTAQPKPSAGKPYTRTSDPGRPIRRGATIYIEEMDQDLDGYIRAELVKKKVPLSVVLSREDAELVMSGTATDEERRKWHEGWLTIERDKTAGNVMITTSDGKHMLWASEAGDRSIWWGALKRGGHRKIADRIVSNLKKAIHN